MNQPARSLIRITGDDRVHFLQGILTQDVTRLADEKIQFAALLSPQGKILHDMFLVAADDSILIDTDARYNDVLIKRLNMYKLRAKVAIDDVSDQWQVALGDERGLPDPRHADLPKRVYISSPNGGGLGWGHDGQSPSHAPLPTSPRRGEAPHPSPLSLGIPTLGVDFEPDSVVALDAGYDLLHGVSFTKGCYVGQEITARMHYKNIARRGFFILKNEAEEVVKLAVLKFEDMFNPTCREPQAPSLVTVDNMTYTAHLPGWMQPKRTQFETANNNQ
jgi:folate-binding protein YgfZ